MDIQVLANIIMKIVNNKKYKKIAILSLIISLLCGNNSMAIVDNIYG